VFSPPLFASNACTDNCNDGNQTPVHGATGPDEFVDIVNPGSNGADLGSATDGTGDLCALIYVVDVAEELEECCGCLVTPDQLIELSVQKDLTANPHNGRIFTSGVIKIISSVPSHFPSGGGAPTAITGGMNEYSNGNCDPTAPIPTPTLREWITHVRSITGVTGYGVTEVEFAYAPLSGTPPTGPGAGGSGEAGFLADQCYNIRTQGTGAGRCNCPTGPGHNDVGFIAR
jgi:hypothetical protein